MNRKRTDQLGLQWSIGASSGLSYVVDFFLFVDFFLVADFFQTLVEGSFCGPSGCNPHQGHQGRQRGDAPYGHSVQATLGLLT